MNSKENKSEKKVEKTKFKSIIAMDDYQNVLIVDNVPSCLADALNQICTNFEFCGNDLKALETLMTFIPGVRVKSKVEEDPNTIILGRDC